MIIVGLGTGRSASSSLARLINMQPRASCFHEICPSTARWHDTPQPVLSMVREFRDILAGGPRQLTIDYSLPNRDRPLERLRSLDRVDVIGDVASYYLPYVEMLASMSDDIRFPCIRRPRAETVASFVEKMRVERTPVEAVLERLLCALTGRRYHTHRNHWVDDDQDRWRPDEIWDSCFPKYAAKTLPEAIGFYWDEYYATVERLVRAFPDQVRLFEIDALNNEHGQHEILNFVGCGEHRTFTSVRANVGRQRRLAG